MEKIQSAIAKARADRAAASVSPGIPANVPASIPEGRAAPAAAVPTPGPIIQHSTRVASRILTTYPDEAVAFALASRWQTIPTFQPSMALMARGHIATFTGGPEAVHFDVMRTRLLQLMRANGWKRVAITSPGPACGKSTLVLNVCLGLTMRLEVPSLMSFNTLLLMPMLL